MDNLLPLKYITFSEYITKEKIIQEICKIRIKETIKYNRDILYKDKYQNLNHIIYQYTPPRKTWIQIGKYKRKKNSTTAQNNYDSLLLTINKYRNTDSSWTTNLNKLINKIFLNIELNSPLEKPYILNIPKPNGKLRKISIYKLEDRIISSLLYKFLIERYDNTFSVNSYGFRGEYFKKEIKNNTREGILSKIIENKLDTSVIVDIDIKSFFDEINKESIKDKIKLLELDEYSKILINSFIDGYSFKEGKGIPQGNGISCFLANLVLNDLDKHIEANYPNIIYIRYVDDILAVINNCTNNLYADIQNNIKDLGLELHLISDDKKGKSKVYLGNKKLTFLGYSVKGSKVKIKKESLEREFLCQKEAIDKLIRIYYSKKYNKKQYKKILKNFLIKWTHRISSKETNKYSWSTGFNLLRINRFSESQIKLLDKKFDRQLTRIRKLGFSIKTNYKTSYFAAFN